MQKLTKIYFFKKLFFPEGGLKPFFLLLILIDILKGYFKKNYKNFEISVLLCPGCLEWPPLGANFFGGGKKNP